MTRVAFGTTLLDVDNRDLTLRPGMTAVATIQANERGATLLVPNSVLRFTPAQAGAAPKASGSLVSQLVPRPPGMGGARRASGGGADAAANKRLWVLRDGTPVAVPVSVGATDGKRTEVSAQGLAEGDAVVVDQRSSAAVKS